MRRYQRGVTFIGWVILMIPMAIVFYAGIRIVPMYLNYMKVSHTMDALAAEVPNEGQTQDGIRNQLLKHFIVDSIDYPTDRDVKIVRDNGTWTLEANYEDQAPLFWNAALLLTFYKKVKLKGGGE
jgi:hypothetical protein